MLHSGENNITRGLATEERCLGSAERSRGLQPEFAVGGVSSDRAQNRDNHRSSSEIPPEILELIPNDLIDPLIAKEINQSISVKRLCGNLFWHHHHCERYPERSYPTRQFPSVF